MKIAGFLFIAVVGWAQPAREVATVRPSAPGATGFSMSPPGAAALPAILPGGIHADNISVATLAALLRRPLGKPLVDETGIAGNSGAIRGV
jgi:hypothetical protein